jgi:PAS domain S-box-containing protein
MHSKSPPTAFALFSGLTAIAVGALVLFGWTFRITELTSIVPGRVAMNPATAICFILAGMSLSFLRMQRPAALGRRIARLAALVVAVVGAAKVTEYLLGWELGIDRQLFRARLENNEIAPNTAFNFILIGLALLCLDYKTRRGRWPAQSLALIVAIGSILSLVGYAFGARVLYGVSSSIPMALNTAAVFHLLSLGIFAARPECGMAGVFLGNSVGGVLSRRLVPAAIAIPAVLGWLRLAGQNRGLYDSELGVAVMVAVTIIALLLLILWTAGALNRMDGERLQAEASLRASEDTFRLLVDSVQDYAIFMLDAHGHVATWNVGAQRIKGYTAEEIIGQHVSRFLPDGSAPGKLDQVLARAATDGRFEDEGWRQRQDGTRFWANVIITPVRSAGGQLTGFAKVTRDITQHMQAEEAIRKLTETLEERVIERTADLAESNCQLRQQNEENEMFVYSVSHDLRSPLVNLEGFSQEVANVCHELRELLDDATVPISIRTRGFTLLDGDMAESIRYIKQAVLRLGGIIDSLLRLSRAGRVEYRPQIVDINPIVARVLDSMRATIAELGASVQTEVLPDVWGDAVALDLIFANLVGNSLKFLDPSRPGRIEIGWRSEPCSGLQRNAMTFFVRDNGLGIAAEYQEKIFQAFKRVHPQVAEGDGMGLAIVRRIVERHRGKVWVESAAGCGSTFFVALPQSAAEGRGGEPLVHEMNRETHVLEERLATCTMNH